MMGRIPTLAECKPGTIPVEYRVLIATEIVEEKTKGGIFLPDTVKEVDQLAAVRGRLVAIGGMAGSLIWPDTHRKPQPGDVVLYARYAGTPFDGPDGISYRLMHDKDISAVIEEPSNG